jgi:hypothetical protein
MFAHRFLSETSIKAFRLRVIDTHAILSDMTLLECLRVECHKNKVDQRHARATVSAKLTMRSRSPCWVCCRRRREDSTAREVERRVKKLRFRVKKADRTLRSFVTSNVLPVFLRKRTLFLLGRQGMHCGAQKRKSDLT